MKPADLKVHFSVPWDPAISHFFQKKSRRRLNEPSSSLNQAEILSSKTHPELSNLKTHMYKNKNKNENTKKNKNMNKGKNKNENENENKNKNKHKHRHKE